MLEMIESYRKGTVSFPQLVGELVGGLEGALDAGEFQNAGVVEQFYDFWQPLEITNAIRGDTVTYEEVAENLETTQRFLLEHLIYRTTRKILSGCL
jgi:hypothetical protein